MIRWHDRRAVAWWASLVAALLAGGCGSGARTPAASSSTSGVSAPQGGAPSGGSCDRQVAATLGEVAARLYRESESGSNVREATKRLERSPALAAAVSSGDRKATTAALTPLLAGQILRVRVQGAGRTLADVGTEAVLAPASGALSDAAGRPIGRFVLSVQSIGSFVSVAAGLTGAEVLLRAGTQLVRGTLATLPPGLPDSGRFRYRGRVYEVLSFPAQAYPSGPLQVSLMVPLPATGCGAGAAQTRAATLGAVARRLYAGEASGSAVHSALTRIVRFKPLVGAVAAGDPTATRDAIVRLFQSHIHVVRIRALRGSQLVNDVGGPLVLAPAAGDLRDARGRIVGRILIALQDDAGYVKLVQRFTGADVVLSGAQGVLMSTLGASTAALPDRGAVTYAGRRWQAYSFTGQIFPSGPLRITILVPAR